MFALGIQGMTSTIVRFFLGLHAVGGHGLQYPTTMAPDDMILWGHSASVMLPCAREGGDKYHF